MSAQPRPADEDRTGTRYCPERSLPTHAYVPGRTARSHKPLGDEHPASWSGTEAALTSAPEFLWGVDLFNHGFYWEAHEAWETLWTCAEPQSAPRDLLQGLIQCAAAALKASSQQWSACRSLTEKALAKFSRVIEGSGDHFLGLDLRQFAACFQAYVDEDCSEPPRLEAAEWLLHVDPPP